MDKILAINGGKPVRTEALPYAHQLIDDDDCRAVVEVLKSDFLTTGPKCKEFENKVADMVGAKYAVSFANGTAALHGACYAAGIKEGDEVITTPITFAASANCVRYCGGTVVFADINPETFNIDPEDIKRKITPKTKAIIPVDYAGQSVDIDAINKIAKEHNLVVIQDSAHSLGTKYKNKYVGGLCDMTEFSFHPVKNITSGEGGMICTNNKEFYEKLVNFRTHCIEKDKDRLINQQEGAYYYEQNDLGYNYRLTDVQSALAISQLNKLNFFAKRRKWIVNKYNEAFKDIPEITLCKNEDFSNSVNHLYVIRLNLDKLNADRKLIYESYIAEGIGAHVHYVPVYYHPYYQSLGYKKGLCPHAEKLYNEMLTLPLFPAMTDKDVEDVIEATKKIMNYYKK